LKEIAKFLGCGFSIEEESNGIVNKTGRIISGIENKAFLRRGQVGDWKNLLTTETIEMLNTITENKLSKHGLSF